ncbi:MAG: UPF0182 family protein, partial [Leptolyngbyaceae cyanobacterium]
MANRLSPQRQTSPQPTSPHSPPSRRLGYGQRAIALILVLLVLHGISTAIVEKFWFEEVNYVPIFWTELWVRLGLGSVAFGVSMAWVLGNAAIARRLAWSSPNVAAAREGRHQTSPTSISGETDKQDENAGDGRVRRRTFVTNPIYQNYRPDNSTLLGAMRLWLLVLTVIFLGSMLTALLLYHGHVAFSHWYPTLNVLVHPDQVPIMFRPETLWQSSWSLVQNYPWIFGGVPALLVAIAFYPHTVLSGIAVSMSVGFSILLSEYWRTILLATHPVPFGELDPIFHRDIGFYIFQLPILELIAFWAVGLGWLTLLSVTLIYLLSGNSLSQGYFPGFPWPQRRHLYAVSSPVMGAIAFSYWIDRYELLYSPTGVTYGASYTNVVAQLPINTGLSILAGMISIYFLVRSVLHPSEDPALVTPNPVPPYTSVLKRREIPDDLGLYNQPTAEDGTDLTAVTTLQGREASVTTVQLTPERRNASQQRKASQQRSDAQRRNGPNRATIGTATDGNSLYRSCRISTDPDAPPVSPFFLLAVCYLIFTLLGSMIVPPLVQRLMVQPNELARERPYLEHTIDATRKAFDLDEIDVRIFDPQTNLTYDDLRNNNFTINNIRLWDTRPLLETNRQLQRIRLYYEFPNADVDRYLFSENPDYDAIADPSSDPQAIARQVLIAARELDYDSVPDEAKTWVNEHLIYTHGYGFTMSPVNTANSSGLPDYFIRGIEHTASDRSVEQAVPVINPRIYYGELTDTYVMTPSEVEELDYPSGSENVYTRYQGDGGVAIGTWQRRLLFAKYLRDWRMLLTENVTPETKLLMRRTIGDRIRAIAPFLRYDADPYLVVADTSLPSHGNADSDRPASNLFWIIDAYTTSDRYPYSDPLDNDFNYIRNSVKVVVDAYHGTVEFYIADADDPIIQAWNQIFPDMFRPLDTMPQPLLSHIRYPQDYYQVQSQQLMTYHMTDPRVLYNREDQWRSPQEIYADQQQPLEPYYLSMRLPTEDQGEFILLHPYTPSQRRNLIAWLAARSDGITSPIPENNHYGKRLLYVFPKQELVFGPEQIEARINQDPTISEQISLWNRTGSRAIQGNLLVIPIEDSLLYVEPIYLEAEQDQLPTLVRVIAVYDNRIVMEKTLADALRAVFNGDRPAIDSQPSPSE